MVAEQQRSPYLITRETTLAQPMDALQVPAHDEPFTPEEATYVAGREAEIETNAARDAAVARRVTESLDLASFRAFVQLMQSAAYEPVQINGAQQAGNVQA